MTDVRPAVQLTLDANAVAAPVHTAAVICREIVDFYFGAMANADLSKVPPSMESTFFRFDLRGPDLTATDRRALHESWILAKVFQDLMRGVRASLEQALVFIDILSRPSHSVRSDSTLDDFVEPFLDGATKRNFPDLLQAVNAGLQKPLEFADAYRSLQKARNCFEHRSGIVGKSDVGPDGTMELRFPRIKLFYYRRGEEIEAEIGKAVDPEDGEPEVSILMRLDVRRRNFLLGQRLSLTIVDFNEIAFACYHFGSQLASTLPTLPLGPVPAQP
jgi:hypothetical protein